jgi:predicted extracellular nuclease
MRFLRFGVAALILASTASGQVVISQVYGGGQGGAAVYKNDYVELYNPTFSPVTLDNWSVQYQASGSTGNWSGKVTLTGTIGANKYFLVQMSASSGSGAGALDLPTPDFASTAVGMSATSGKVALASNATTLSTAVGPPVVCPSGGAVADLVGYGAANCSETSAVPALTTTTAAFRAGGGCTDTGNNSADFTTGAPLPRNSASPANVCGSPSPTSPTATGLSTPNSVPPGNSTTLSATVTPGANPVSSGLAVACTLTAIGGGASVSLPSPTFSTDYTVPAGTAPSTYVLPCTVSDAQSRSSSFSISLTVQAPPAPFHRIYEITGPGTSSPLLGQAVNTRGVVTGIRAATSSVRGFYVESLAADRDADPNTSEGVLIFTGSAAPPACVAVGNYIQFDSTVSDFVSSTSPVGTLPLTELASPANCQVLATGQMDNLPSPVTIDAGHPLVVGGSATQSRAFLSMRVSVPNATVVGASLGSSNESSATTLPNGQFFVTLPGISRPLQPGGILATRRPSDAASTVPSWNGNPEVLRIDITGLAPAATPYMVATGATVTGLSGVMDYATGQGQYQLYTNSAGAGTPDPASPTMTATPVPVALPNDLTIGSFNMERFYNDVDEHNGAVTLTTAAYQGRLAKASLAIRNVMRMPDLIGLEEVEGQRNTAGSTAVHVIKDIVDRVNADAVAAGQGNPSYNYCIALSNDPGAITVAIIYKESRVQLASCTIFGIDTQYQEPGGTFNFLNDRPPVTVAVNVTAPGSDSPLPVRLVANHLRSLSGIDEPGAANGDRVRAKRNEQAKYLANLITGNVDQSINWNLTDNLVIVGDFNAYQVNDGYVDVMNCIAGNPAAASAQYTTAAQSAVSPACTPIPVPPLTLLTLANPAGLYSYTFSGTAQTIDHVLLNTKANSRFRQIVYARNDADFPEGPIYRNNITRPERVTDHDMPVVYLRLPVEVTSRTKITASGILLNRATGRYNGTIKVANTGTAPLTGPVYVFFKNLPAGVTLPDLPQYNGVPYVTINLPSGLAAGATSGTVTISFADPSAARIGYTTQTFDRSF